MDQNKLETFYRTITTQPVNIEQVVLQVGHKCDFIDECAMFNLVIDFIKQHNVDTKENITAEIYNQFSHFINAPLEEGDNMKTRIQKEKTDFAKSMKNLNFKDIGDIQTVILPMAQLNRKQIDYPLIQHLEKQLRLDSDLEKKEKIHKIGKVEEKKEAHLEEYFKKVLPEKPEFYNEYFKPIDVELYCYERALCLYYFSFITDVDKTLDSYHTSVEILSFTNFIYPNGNVQEFETKIDQNKFNQELENIEDFLPSKQYKDLLAQLRTTKEEVNENAKKEIEEEKQLQNNQGLLE